MKTLFTDIRGSCIHYSRCNEWFRSPNRCDHKKNALGICAKTTCPRIAESFPTFVCTKCRYYGKSCAGTEDETPCGKWIHITTGESISDILGLVGAANVR